MIPKFEAIRAIKAQLLSALDNEIKIQQLKLLNTIEEEITAHHNTLSLEICTPTDNKYNITPTYLKYCILLIQKKIAYVNALQELLLDSQLNRRAIIKQIQNTTLELKIIFIQEMQRLVLFRINGKNLEDTANINKLQLQYIIKLYKQIDETITQQISAENPLRNNLMPFVNMGRTLMRLIMYNIRGHVNEANDFELTEEIIVDFEKQQYNCLHIMYDYILNKDLNENDNVNNVLQVLLPVIDRFLVNIPENVLSKEILLKKCELANNVLKTQNKNIELLIYLDEIVYWQLRHHITILNLEDCKILIDVIENMFSRQDITLHGPNNIALKMTHILCEVFIKNNAIFDNKPKYLMTLANYLLKIDIPEGLKSTVANMFNHIANMFFHGEKFKKNLDKALEWYELGFKMAPSSKIANAIGEVYKQIGDSSLAIQYFNQALELDPDFIDARINLAYLTFELNNIEEAVTLLTPHLDQNNLDNFYKCAYHIGLIYFYDNNHEKSLEYFSLIQENAQELTSNIQYYIDKIKLCNETLENPTPTVTSSVKQKTSKKNKKFKNHEPAASNLLTFSYEEAITQPNQEPATNTSLPGVTPEPIQTELPEKIFKKALIQQHTTHLKKTYTVESFKTEYSRLKSIVFLLNPNMSFTFKMKKIANFLENTCNNNYELLQQDNWHIISDILLFIDKTFKSCKCNKHILLEQNIESIKTVFTTIVNFLPQANLTMLSEILKLLSCLQINKEPLYNNIINTILLDIEDNQKNISCLLSILKTISGKVNLFSENQILTIQTISNNILSKSLAVSDYLTIEQKITLIFVIARLSATYKNLYDYNQNALQILVNEVYSYINTNTNFSNKFYLLTQGYMAIEYFKDLLIQDNNLPNLLNKLQPIILQSTETNTSKYQKEILSLISTTLQNNKQDDYSIAQEELIGILPVDITVKFINTKSTNKQKIAIQVDGPPHYSFDVDVTTNKVAPSMALPKYNLRNVLIQRNCQLKTVDYFEYAQKLSKDSKQKYIKNILGVSATTNLKCRF